MHTLYLKRVLRGTRYQSIPKPLIPWLSQDVAQLAVQVLKKKKIGYSNRGAHDWTTGDNGTGTRGVYMKTQQAFNRVALTHSTTAQDLKSTLRLASLEQLTQTLETHFTQNLSKTVGPNDRSAQSLNSCCLWAEDDSMIVYLVSFVQNE